jgi:hypothetical protein
MSTGGLFISIQSWANHCTRNNSNRITYIVIMIRSIITVSSQEQPYIDHSTNSMIQQVETTPKEEHLFIQHRGANEKHPPPRFQLSLCQASSPLCIILPISCRESHLKASSFELYFVPWSFRAFAQKPQPLKFTFLRRDPATRPGSLTEVRKHTAASTKLSQRANPNI